MDDALFQFIAAEEAKLKVLEAEAVTRRNRIAVLKNMLQSTGELDAFLAKASTAATSAPVSGQQVVRRSSATWPLPGNKPAPSSESGENPEGGVRKQRKKGEIKFVLLSALSFAPEPLSDIQLRVKELGYDLTYDRVRTQLWSFKNDGLVESPEKGHYCLTEKGAAFVQIQKGESPVGAGLSGATKSDKDEL